MQKPFVLFVAATLAAAACSAPDNKTKPASVRPDTPAAVPAGPEVEVAVRDSLSWTDRAVMRYIAESRSAILTWARSHGQQESWMIDRDEDRDSATFLVIHIGHHEAEADGSDPRFATDAWIYLDTVRKRIFEYDLPNDSLVRWE